MGAFQLEGCGANSKTTFLGGGVNTVIVKLIHILIFVS